MLILYHGQNSRMVSARVERIVANRGNAGNQHFLYSNNVSKGFFQMRIKTFEGMARGKAVKKTSCTFLCLFLIMKGIYFCT